MSPILVDLALALTSLALIAGYHIRLRRRVRTQPERTATGRHRIDRRAWIAAMAGGQHDILVVQTLRNWIMSSSFMASTAILFALGLGGLAFSTTSLSSIAHELNFLGSVQSAVLLFKTLLLMVDFLTAFFCFSLAIRAFIHVGFTLNLPGDCGRGAEAAKEFEQGALGYTLGLRCFYLSLPLSLWLFGPIWLLVGSALLLIVLRKIDQ